MATINVNPFGQNASVPDGYPIADDLNTNKSNYALSAKQGKLLGDELHTLKILSIGNSFSRDSLSYVPIIMAQMGLKVEIGILYHSSCSLQMHWENRATANYYVFDYFKQSDGKWKQENNKSLSYGLGFDDWDVVLLQQNSGNAYDYATVQPYLNDLIGLVSASLTRVTFGWILTHAWATGYSGYTSKGITQTEYVEDTKAVAKSVMENSACQLLLPYGIAIDLARKDSTLSAIGDDLCYTDKVHLLEGIACQTAAYANATAIAKFLHNRKSIVGDTTRVTSSWLTTYAIPEQHGSATGSTDANCKLAQRYAIIANNEFNL
jgi:hypothetical protein